MCPMGEICGCRGYSSSGTLEAVEGGGGGGVLSSAEPAYKIGLDTDDACRTSPVPEQGQGVHAERCA